MPSSAASPVSSAGAWFDAGVRPLIAYMPDVEGATWRAAEAAPTAAEMDAIAGAARADGATPRIALTWAAGWQAGAIAMALAAGVLRDGLLLRGGLEVLVHRDGWVADVRVDDAARRGRPGLARGLRGRGRRALLADDRGARRPFRARAGRPVGAGRRRRRIGGGRAGRLRAAPLARRADRGRAGAARGARRAVAHRARPALGSHGARAGAGRAPRLVLPGLPLRDDARAGVLRHVPVPRGGRRDGARGRGKRQRARLSGPAVARGYRTFTTRYMPCAWWSSMKQTSAYRPRRGNLTS